MSANRYGCYYTEYMQCINQFYVSCTQDTLGAALLLAGLNLCGCIFTVSWGFPLWLIKWLCEMASQDHNLSKEVLISIAITKHNGLWTRNFDLFNNALTIRGTSVLLQFGTVIFNINQSNGCKWTHNWGIQAYRYTSLFLPQSCIIIFHLRVWHPNFYRSLRWTLLGYRANVRPWTPKCGKVFVRKGNK